LIVVRIQASFGESKKIRSECANSEYGSGSMYGVNGVWGLILNSDIETGEIMKLGRTLGFGATTIALVDEHLYGYISSKVFL